MSNFYVYRERDEFGEIISASSAKIAAEQSSYYEDGDLMVVQIKKANVCAELAHQITNYITDIDVPDEWIGDRELGLVLMPDNYRPQELEDYLCKWLDAYFEGHADNNIELQECWHRIAKPEVIKKES